MDPLTLGLIGGAGVSALGGFVTSALNNRSQQKENQIMREREDNAISRRMADLSASGLSPTLAAGSAASAQSGTANKYDSMQGAFDFASKYMALLQGKSDYFHTNAQTALTQLQADSEKFSQAFMQAQTEEVNLRNQWINADMASKLNLRDLQGQKVGEELKEITANTALLQAKTAYEQANRDFIMTQNDSEKIRQDMLMLDRNWHNSLLGSKIWNNYTSGGMLKSILGIGGSLGSMLTDSIKSIKSGVDNSSNWFYPSR